VLTPSRKKLYGDERTSRLDDISRALYRPDPHNHLKVIGLERACKDEPALLFALVLNELLAALLDFAY
jgi:hypothetical protein